MGIKINKSKLVVYTGLLSLLIFWCYAIIGLILSIISITTYSKNFKKSAKTTKSIKVAYFSSVLGLILSSVYLIFIIIYFFYSEVALSTAFGTMPWDMF